MKNKNIRVLVILILIIFVLLASYQEYIKIRSNKKLKQIANQEKQIFGDPNYMQNQYLNGTVLKNIVIDDVKYNESKNTIEYTIKNNSNNEVFINNEVQYISNNDRIYAYSTCKGNISDKKIYQGKLQKMHMKISINPNEKLDFELQLNNVKPEKINLKHIIYEDFKTSKILGVVLK